MRIYEKLESGIIIAEYQDSHAASFAEMENMSAGNWGGSAEVVTESQVRARAASTSNLNKFVALDGDTVAGTCTLGKYYADADTLYVPYLNVRPDYMGKKIGKALLLRAIARAGELGYPRIDLHTWPGNTNAVPLYKKCGFFWEDRPETNHFACFIPGILGHEMFRDYFSSADWYADSARALTAGHDGAKANGFEFFEYSWESGGGALKIGFERSGRSVRMVETDDYRVEFSAEGHELAFGMRHKCWFDISSKNGKALEVGLRGEDDGPIRFGLDEKVSTFGLHRLEADFFVAEVEGEIGKFRTHPCVRASLSIGGRHIAFGLGIRAKFPVRLELRDDYRAKRPGMRIPCWLNVRSALPQAAKVSVEVPDNGVLAFDRKLYVAEMPKKGAACIEAEALVLAAGHAPAPAKVEIAMGGETLRFEHPLHLFATGLNEAFGLESDEWDAVANGPWMLRLQKRGNRAVMSHMANDSLYVCRFVPPRLGKPYDNEFGLIKPDIRKYQEGRDMALSAEYASAKHDGLVVRQVFALSASGMLSVKCAVENRGSLARAVMLSAEHSMPVGAHAVFRMGGETHMNHSFGAADGPWAGLDALEPGALEENWLFEDSPKCPVGVCWTPGLKIIPDWGNFAAFEADCGTIEPGGRFDAGEVRYVFGAFANHRDFRNYALGIADMGFDMPRPRVEERVNGHNPFVKEGEPVLLEIANNRETEMDGRITVKIAGRRRRVKGLRRELSPGGSPVQLVETAMKLSTYEKTAASALFFPRGGVERTEDGARLVVNNGAIEFAADPSFAHSCNSLVTLDDGKEWLNSQYPELKPYAWWNPFVGGLHIVPDCLNIAGALRERISAGFAEITDSFGNVWHGIKTTLAVTENEEARGMAYHSYFLTMPGLPLLCAFFSFENGTGLHRNEEASAEAYLNFGGGKVAGLLADAYGREMRVRFGKGEVETDFVNEVRLESGRKKNMYAFRGNKAAGGGENELFGDTKLPPSVFAEFGEKIPPGRTRATAPLFLLASAKDLPRGSLDGLERVRFDCAGGAQKGAAV